MPSRILIYTRNIKAMADFYVRHFSYVAVPDADGRIIELRPGTMGGGIMLHQAAKSVKLGQAAVKLVFDVADVAGFVAAARGLKLGTLHTADGYQFANAKDPDGNSISVSSRAFRKTR